MAEDHPETRHTQNFWDNQFNLITAAALIGLICGILLITFLPQGNTPAPFLSTSTPSSTFTPDPSPTARPSDTPAPTAFPSPVPTQTIRTGAAPTPYGYAFTPEHGTLILSIRRGKHYQLFAYQPFLDRDQDQLRGLPLTQLTADDHDKIQPALSPDGSRLAYASNQDGSWDIYIWNLETGEARQVTNSPGYEAYPNWSPDGQWITFESYQADNLEIIIQNAVERDTRINLSSHPGQDFSPHWSPQGRKISFISTRSGQKQILVADLDLPEEDKSSVLANLTNPIIRHPVWSPEGRYLSWVGASEAGYSEIHLWDSTRPEAASRPLGKGSWTAWDGSGELLYAVHQTPAESFLTAYPVGPGASQTLLPPLKLPGSTRGITWAKDVSLEKVELPQENQLSAGDDDWPYNNQVTSGTEIEKQDLVSLTEVEAPHPKLNQQALESFQALKTRTADVAGWDFLSVLNNAYLPLTTPLEPTGGQEWLHTGRAVEVSDLPRQAGWLIVVKEEYGGETYWRLYLRARRQDGSQGQPLKSYPWDFDQLYSGSYSAYEQGGARGDSLPGGYWVDFTDLAAGYGWTRFPALPRWRTAYPQARWQMFAFSQGLTWEQAMLEIYPDLVLITPTPFNR
jgi:TolB protein